ncbi:tetracycline resistance protein from transposon [Colletotrichum orchidophilum]|uniref:Tetracycline resistance protein from transposon n=1 Tax=Colletotrichum orchidophilum TaxID=1209926 RepID=A0A1G4BCV5_9PEZI|nr:tetracycline resistance protein from transposon [Colletotrichum orchidophilum]OHE99152.1 tetracycline resistance protein from transposon [Colletotrichum orchidophilum]
MQNPKIAIIGAGPAGCLLARLLYLSKVEATVFESEASPNFRWEGGSLDLHTNTGLAALKEAGLFEEFLRYARYDGQYLAIVDKNNKPWFVKSATGLGSTAQERPEIDRSKLREILAESLPKDVIKWGHRLREVKEDGSLVFEHTTITGFDLVVGADGAWSKVRKLLAPDVKPLWSGIKLYGMSIPNAAETAPEIYKLVNRGSVFANSDGKRISIQQMGDGSLSVYASSTGGGEDWASPEVCGYDSNDLEAVKKALSVVYQDWAPELTDAIARTAGDCTPRSLYMLPVGFKWSHRRGVTMIGDAAHLMTPYAGEGVNVALEDATKLAKAIISAVAKGGAPELLDQRIEAFEREMFPRVEKVQRLTDELMHDFMFTPGSPRTTIATSIARHVKFETPWVFHPLATAMVHSFFFMRRMLAP